MSAAAGALEPASSLLAPREVAPGARDTGARGIEAPSATVLASRALAFAALAFAADMRFASLLVHPPAWRVAGVAAACAVGGAALARTGGLRDSGEYAGLVRASAVALRLAIIALAAYGALTAAGAPALHALPWHWNRLGEEVTSGVNALDGRWPYGGTLIHPRLAIMFALGAVTATAAALAFWPGARRGPARRAGALALLVGLYTTGAVNEPQGAWQVQGVLLLVLLCTWAWVWRSRPLEPLRALTCVLAGGLAALLLAGALHSSKPLLDYRTWNPFGPTYPPTSFDWNQTFGTLRWPNTSETMVEVAAAVPHLWRATTLDEFDGVGFVRSRAADRITPRGPPLDARWIERVSFALRGLRSKELLSPGQILYAAIEGEGLSRLQPIAADGTVRVSAAPPPSGDRYTVTAYTPHPSAAELRAAPYGFPAAYARYALPVEASAYAGVRRLARRIAAGASSEYDVVARMLAFLRRGFTYTETPPPRAFPLAAFLLHDRRGFCQQFAGAMALMLRMDGIPARVAAGFLPGSRIAASGLYRITAHDAHSWVEAYFSGIGWVAFDPTPPAPALTGARVVPPGEGSGGGELRRTLSTARQHRVARVGLRAPGGHARAGAGALAVIAIAIVSVLALGFGAALLASRARLRRAFAGDADGAARELARAFTRVGRPLAEGTTLAELESRLESSRDPSAGRYVRLLRERRYSPAGSRLPSARERRRLRRALRGGRGPRAWARALLALPPGPMPRRRARDGAR